MEDLLRQGLPELGIPQDEALVTAFASYLRLLDEWNENINLTGIRELADMVPLHILDSLTARPFLQGERIVDVGTGAGLPGIPLALVDRLAEPARHFTLVDGTLKKIRFVQQAIADLELANAEALHVRIEDHKPVPLYDTVICRAVSSLSDFVRRAGGVVAPVGQLLAMKGKLPVDEIRALPKGWRAAAVTPVKIPGVDAERHIIQIVRGQIVRQ